VEPGDANDIDELFRLSWSEGFGDILRSKDIEDVRQDRSVTEEDIKERIRREGILTLVYERSGTVMGQGRIAWSESATERYTDTARSEAEFRSVYVHPDHWSEGIGSEIMGELVEQCPVEPVALKVETYEGSDAADFYRSKGFEVVQHSTTEAEKTDMSNDYDTVVLEKRL